MTLPISMTKQVMSRVPWKWVVPGLLVIAVGGYVIWLHWVIDDRDTTIVEQQKLLDTRLTRITSLELAIGRQNDLVEKWRLVAQENEERAAEAMREARKGVERSNQIIRGLEDSQPVTCGDGILLLDKVLQL